MRRIYVFERHSDQQRFCVGLPPGFDAGRYLQLADKYDVRFPASELVSLTTTWGAIRTVWRCLRDAFGCTRGFAAMQCHFGFVTADGILIGRESTIPKLSRRVQVAKKDVQRSLNYATRVRAGRTGLEGYVFCVK